MNRPTVFLSYASEDVNYAQRLYEQLENYNIEIWFDKNTLLAGQNWKVEIHKAIEQTDFFIALISQNYNSKIGFVQSEIRIALELLDLRPPDRIFIIPVRLDTVETGYSRLAALQRVDLFEDWNLGVEKIIRAVRTYPGYITEAEKYKSRLENLTQKICSLEFDSHNDLDVYTELDKMDKLYMHLQETLRIKFAEEYDPLFDISKNQMKRIYRNIMELLDSKEVEIKSKNLEVANLREKENLSQHELDKLQDEIEQLETQIASLQTGQAVLQPVLESKNIEKWRTKWHQTLEQLQSIFSPSNVAYR